MKPSLSILVPVHNAQAQLHGCVQRLLDVLPELNGRFEVLIVDDGSTDATCEVGYELARDYPQVKVSRHATSVGWAATVAKHANNATGEFLMIHCGGAIEADDIISLWRWRYKISASAVRPGTPHNGKSWRLDSESETGWQDVGKIRFTTLLDGCCIHAGATKSNFLLLKRQQLPRLEKCLAEIPRSSRIDSSGVRTPQSFQKAPPGSGIKPPSFLNQLKTFTLGE